MPQKFFTRFNRTHLVKKAECTSFFSLASGQHPSAISIGSFHFDLQRCKYVLRVSEKGCSSEIGCNHWVCQITRDNSTFVQLGLYADDTFDYVRILQVIGNRSDALDSTRIEIFACVRG